MNDRPRRSSDIPARGAIGLALTIGGLALLLSFRSPEPVAETAAALQIQPMPGTEAATTEDSPSVAAARAAGESVSTRWGDVQVMVTTEGGDIVSIDAVSLPARDRRSRQLSDRAEPVLRTQAVVTDSADVDVVSGATYTSRAYRSSLQSALDQLGI